MIKTIYTQCKNCIYEQITDRTAYYMKKYHELDIIKTYFKPANFYIGECDITVNGIIWCDKPGKNNITQTDNKKIIVTSIWLKEYMEKKGIKVEQIVPFGVDDKLAQKHVNFDFNARRGYIIITKNISYNVLQIFEGKRKQLTLISKHPNTDFRFEDLNDDLKYYLMSHSLFYIKIGNEEGFDIYPVEAMSVGTPLIYMRNDINSEHTCGIIIDDIKDLKKIEVKKEEWEDLSWKCWYKSLRYHYITIGQELWKWFS